MYSVCNIHTCLPSLVLMYDNTIKTKWHVTIAQRRCHSLSLFGNIAGNGTLAVALEREEMTRRVSFDDLRTTFI